MLLDRQLSPRTLRRSLYGLSALSLTTAAALCLWTLLPPGDAAIDTATRPVARPRATKMVPVPSLKQLEPLAQQRLRRPLIDPPKKPAAADAGKRRQTPPTPVKRPPRLDWRLIGTAIESGESAADSGDSAAMLIDRQGNIRVVREGEELKSASGTMRIKQIAVDQVTVLLRGKRVELKLPKQPEVLR